MKQTVSLGLRKPIESSSLLFEKKMTKMTTMMKMTGFANFSRFVHHCMLVQICYTTRRLSPVDQIPEVFECLPEMYCER